MAEELFITKLGQTVEEVTLIAWLVQDGEKVAFGQPVLEVETDKAVFPLEANANGYLHLGPYKPGDVVPVLTVVATIGKRDDRFGEAGPAAVQGEAAVPGGAAAAPPVDSPAGQPGAPAGAESERVFISPRAKKLARAQRVDLAQVTPSGGEGRRIIERDVLAFLSRLPRATPVAQNMAARTGLDLGGIQGTGARGTITKADVEHAWQEKAPAGPAEPAAAPAAAQAEPVEPALAPAGPATAQAGPAPAPAGPAVPQIPPAAPELGPEVQHSVPLKGVRGIIFERMGASVHTTARVTLMTEVDATALVEARDQIKANVQDAWGFAPGYNDLLGIIVARALSEFSYMNARLSADGTAIEWVSRINLGMAVDTERGLLVPVIRDADQKGLQSFGAEFRQLLERARTGRSLPDDLAGGTFTITNLGMYDIDAFTPVINLPEVAILGVGRIAPKVTPRDGQVAIRQMLTLSLVFDHRLVDGAPAARFLQRIKQLVETPYLLLG